MTTTKQQRGAALESTTVRLPAELLKWLKVQAMERHVSRAMLIRQMLEDYRDANPD